VHVPDNEYEIQLLKANGVLCPTLDEDAEVGDSVSGDALSEVASHSSATDPKGSDPHDELTVCDQSEFLLAHYFTQK
jgi:hypothetical protein